jgi:hypothetical protein
MLVVVVVLLSAEPQCLQYYRFFLWPACIVYVAAAAL